MRTVHYDKLCHICLMCQASPELAAMLHEYRFTMGIAVAPLAKQMNLHIQAYNESHQAKLDTISSRGLSFHFTKHAPTQERVKYAVQRKMNSQGKKILKMPEASQQIMTANETKHIEQAVSSFDEMMGLFSELKGLYESYKDRQPELHEYSMHLKVIREIRETLSELNKIKQSKEVIKSAVKDVVHAITTQYLEDMGNYLVQTEELISKKFEDTYFAKKFVDDFRERSIEFTMSAVKAGIRKVSSEYGLDQKRVDEE